ncbi:MAG: cupin domain-containing protein [Bacteroidetes bacterium]|nr:MAG: cupin domain-containing protein [Bacteroidota bacterium]
MKHTNFKIIIQLFLVSLVLMACKTDNNLPDPLQAGWNNKAVCELVEENEKIRVLKCTFEPGVGHEKHYHKPHFGYTLAGSKFRMIDADGTREVNVTTGSSFYSEGTDWHEVLNIGDSTAVFLIIEPK